MHRERSGAKSRPIFYEHRLSVVSTCSKATGVARLCQSLFGSDTPLSYEEGGGGRYGPKVGSRYVGDGIVSGSGDRLELVARITKTVSRLGRCGIMDCMRGGGRPVLGSL